MPLYITKFSYSFVCEIDRCSEHDFIYLFMVYWGRQVSLAVGQFFAEPQDGRPEHNQSLIQGIDFGKRAQRPCSPVQKKAPNPEPLDRPAQREARRL